MRFFGALGAQSAAAEHIQQALQASLGQGLAVVDAIVDRGDAIAELNEALPGWENLARLREEFDEADAELMAAVPALVEQLPLQAVDYLLRSTRARRQLNNTVRAAADCLLTDQATGLVLGMTDALDDPSGARIDAFTSEVLRARPEAVMKGLGDRVHEGDARGHLRLGLHELVRNALKDFELLSRPRDARAYAQRAAVENARRDAIDLGRLDKDLFEESRKGEARWHRNDLDAATGSELQADDAVAILEAAETAREREAVISELLESLPEDQAAIVRLVSEGSSWAEACRQLGLPAGRSKAVQMRLKRLRERRAS